MSRNEPVPDHSQVGTKALQKRVRRGPAQIRRLVLTAAADLFVTHGYQATTTRSIADASGVAEPVIFRHFGSKAGVFEATIVAPFAEFIASWDSSWRAEPLASLDAEQITRTFVEGFFTFATDHRALLKTLVAARLSATDSALVEVADRTIEKLAASYSVMRELLTDHATARDWPALDPPATVGIAVGSVLSAVILSDWIFAGEGIPPSQDRQIEELVQLLLHGVSHRTL